MKGKPGWITSHNVFPLTKPDRKAQQKQLLLLLIFSLLPGFVFPLSLWFLVSFCCVHPSCSLSLYRQTDLQDSQQQAKNLAACHGNASICYVIYKATHPFLRPALNLCISRSRSLKNRPLLPLIITPPETHCVKGVVSVIKVVFFLILATVCHVFIRTCCYYDFIDKAPLYLAWKDNKRCNIPRHIMRILIVWHWLQGTEISLIRFSSLLLNSLQNQSSKPDLKAQRELNMSKCFINWRDREVLETALKYAHHFNW